MRRSDRTAVAIVLAVIVAVTVGFAALLCALKWWDVWPFRFAPYWLLIVIAILGMAGAVWEELF